MALNKKSDGQLLEEALLEIKRLEEEIQMLRNQQPYQPIDFYKNVDECNHEYPNPWHSVLPPHCKKCGKQAPDYRITFSDHKTTTGNPPWDFNKYGGNVIDSNDIIITHDFNTTISNSTYMSDKFGIN